MLSGFFSEKKNKTRKKKEEKYNDKNKVHSI